MSLKKRYEGVLFNVISNVTGIRGCQISGGILRNT